PDVAGGAAHAAILQLELGALELARAGRETTALAAHVHRGVEIFDRALEAHAALFGVDLGPVGREQALAHADAHVARQAGVAGPAEFAVVAGDVDAGVVRVGLQQFL